MEEGKRNLEGKSLSFLVWRIEDKKLAMKLWGDYEVDECAGEETKILRDIWDSKSCGESYYPFFHSDTRVLIGVCGLRVYDESRGIYEIDLYVREEWQSRTFEVAKYMVKYALQGTNAGILLAGHGNRDVSKGFLTKLGFEYIHCGSLRGRKLKEVYYLKERRG